MFLVRFCRHFVEVGLYSVSAHIAYELRALSTLLSTTDSDWPGGRLTSGRLPLLHLHHQRRLSCLRFRCLSDELYRLETRLQDVEAQPALSPLRRSLQGQTGGTGTGEDSPEYSLDLSGY